MIKISSLKLKPGHSDEELLEAAAKAAGLSVPEIDTLKILRRSVEARKKEPLALVYSVLIRTKSEEEVRHFLNTKKGKAFARKHAVSFTEKEETYVFPLPFAPDDLSAVHGRPVVIGSGPAGSLCAYELAKRGYAPLVIERGSEVSKRKEKVSRFFLGGGLDEECNVQFGEGGAGTFSDGKLNTGVTDRFCRMKEVLELFVSCGANESILFDAKPHVGSDVLPEMMRSLRKKVESCGGTYLFDSRVDDLCIKDGAVTGVLLKDGERIRTDCVILAIGHSARDTFKMLYERGIKMEPKAFAVGVRCEHDQELINQNQWGKEYPASLGAASYKLTYHALNGRSVYSFCMCPGGYVINASSEEGGLCVNGMSLSGRSSKWANSAIIASVTPHDYVQSAAQGVPAELSGIEFQRTIERKAFLEGRGKIPAQRFEDFVQYRLSGGLCNKGSVKGSIEAGNLNACLPLSVCEALKEGIEAFNKRIKGFSDTVLYGVESRTSSPVRIIRDESFQSNVKGLFPCGEGAGYAGGIMSAAIDGIKTAEAAAAFLLNKGS